MYAIIETGGQQHKVAAGDVLKVEKLTGDVGKKVTFDKVLCVKTDKDMLIGKPYLKGAKVSAEIVEQDRDKKIVVFKFKRRKGYKRTKGHRQFFTKIKITKINKPRKTKEAGDGT